MAASVPQLSELGEPGDLGELIDSFPAQRWPAWRVAVGLVMIVIGVILPPMAVWFAWLVFHSPNFSRKSRAKRVDVHDRGVVLVEAQGPVAVHRFDSAALTAKVVSQSVYGIHTGTGHLYTLTDPHGRSAKITNFYTRIAELGDLLQQRVTAVQGPGVVAAVRAGQEVSFGAFTLRPDGIGTRKGVLAWDALSRVTIDNGVVFVRVHGKRLPAAHAKVPQVVNLRCMLWAMARLRPEQG